MAALRPRKVLFHLARRSAVLVLAACPAWASAVHIGEHAGFGRVVFTVPAGVRETASQQGDRLVVHLPGAGTVAGLAHGPSNVSRIDGGQNQAVLQLAHGSRIRIWQGAGRVVVDVFPALGAPASGPIANAGQAATIAQAPIVALGPGITLVPVGQTPLPPAKKPEAPSPQVGQPAGAPPATAPAASAGEPGPASDSLAAERLPDAGAPGEASILVPFDRTVGAAAFPRGGVAHIVFDDSKPVDLAGLKDDKVFAAARVTLLPAATHLSLPLAAGARLRLRRRPDGWVVTVAPTGAADTSAKLSVDKGVMAIGMPFAADTVVMDDPVTGGRMLVGAVLGDGPGVAVPHVSPEFSLLPSWAGVVVTATSDRLMLRAGKAAFNLSNGSPPELAAQLADASGSAAEAAALTRHFDLPPLPTPALLMRLRANLHAAGSAPKMGRLTQRVLAAQAMLALGLDREASGLLRAAQQDDPAQGGSADAAALLAMANWLAGADPGSAMDDAALGKSDEMTLWRALMQPSTVDRRPAAAAIAATWRLLLAYPEPLQRRLVRPAADTLLQGGQLGAADAVLARFTDKGLDDLRAAALVQHGRIPDALASLDKVSGRSDRKRAAAAARAAVELRLAAHQISPEQAASSLEKRLFAWRDEATEISQRVRVAALRMQAGKWRQALALLRETDSLFPQAHDQVHSAELAVVADLLRAGQAQRLPPLDLVALVEESADLLAAKDASSTLAPVLVDKLLALDLPDRAEPVLAHMMVATDDAEAKAGLGAKLATLRLEGARPLDALAALDASEAATLPASLTATRAVVRARALAASGQVDKALALLTGLSSPQALDVQARLLEDRKDWHRAEGVLLTLAHTTLPPDGRLAVAQQDLLLRVASAAAEAGDIAVLQQMQSANGARLDPGPRSALFQALVQQPVQSLTDLPRSGREADAARAVPAALTNFDGR
jgi:hypothetical protein